MSPPDFHLRKSIIHLRQLPLPYVVDLTQLQDVALLWGGRNERQRYDERSIKEKTGGNGAIPDVCTAGEKEKLVVQGGKRGRRRRPSRSAPLFILASPSSLVVMDNSCGAERKHSRSYSPPLQLGPPGGGSAVLPYAVEEEGGNSISTNFLPAHKLSRSRNYFAARARGGRPHRQTAGEEKKLLPGPQIRFFPPLISPPYFIPSFLRTTLGLVGGEEKSLFLTPSPL